MAETIQASDSQVEAQRAIEKLRVTSNLDRPITGRFDGTDYVFRKGRPVELTVQAAGHIFGLFSDNKKPALNQLGLMRPTDDYEESLKLLGQISFERGRTVYDEDEPGAKAAGKGTGGRRPHVRTAGGAGEPAGEPEGSSSSSDEDGGGDGSNEDPE